MLRWYTTSLTRRPLLTQSIATTLLFATGDVLSQQAIERAGASAHDPQRTLRMGAYGGLVFAPLVVNWYRLLQRVHIPSSRTLEILARVALDQAVFSPCNLALFFSSMEVMESGAARSAAGVKRKLEESWWKGLRANWTLWPAVQVVNFRFVPLEHRVLVVNVVSIGWNSYLSYLNQQTSKGAKGQEESRREEGGKESAIEGL